MQLFQVPDRGGRPNEQQPPPPEMPSWQQRTTAPQVSESFRLLDCIKTIIVQQRAWYTVCQ